MKGGALLLGADTPGLPGPFGTWIDAPELDGPDAEDPGTTDRGEAR